MNEIISISGWIVAVLLGIPAAIYYSLRILKEQALKQTEDMKSMREVMAVIIKAQVAAEKYNTGEFANYSPAWFYMHPQLKKENRDRLLTLQSLAKDFEFWLGLAEGLISATMFKAAYYDGIYSEFSQKMDSTGRGHFHDLLSNNFRFHILSGQDMTVPWVRDNCPSFYSELMSVGSQEDIEKVLESIQAVTQSQCLQIMREKQQEYLKEVDHVARHLRLLTGEK